MSQKASVNGFTPCMRKITPCRRIFCASYIEILRLVYDFSGRIMTHELFYQLFAVAILHPEAKEHSLFQCLYSWGSNVNRKTDFWEYFP